MYYKTLFVLNLFNYKHIESGNKIYNVAITQVFYPVLIRIINLQVIHGTMRGIQLTKEQ